MSNIHELKCFVGRFEQFWQGLCKADVRFDDKGYSAGDTVFLYEGYPDNDDFEYTGRVIAYKITYVDTFAVQQGFVVLSLEKRDEVC